MDTDKIIELGQRLQGLFKEPDGTTETRAYNDAIGDAVDYLFRLADAPPEYKMVKVSYPPATAKNPQWQYVAQRVLPEIPLRQA